MKLASMRLMLPLFHLVTRSSPTQSWSRDTQMRRRRPMPFPSPMRAEIVRNYLEARYPFDAKNVGVMPLSATPPTGLGHEQWSGVSILVAEKK